MTPFVSTLTRPEDRVRPFTGRLVAHEPRRFNPHPARRPGATNNIRSEGDRDHVVSTLTRPEDRVRQARKGLGAFILPFQPSPGPKTGCDPLRFRDH